MRFINLLLLSSVAVLAAPSRERDVANQIEDRDVGSVSTTSHHGTPILNIPNKIVDRQEMPKPDPTETDVAHSSAKFHCPGAGEIDEQLLAMVSLEKKGGEIIATWTPAPVRGGPIGGTAFVGSNKVRIVERQTRIEAFKSFVQNGSIVRMWSIFTVEVDLKTGTIVNAWAGAPVLTEQRNINGAFSPPTACPVEDIMFG
ncbi:hypothetical protein Ptr902_11107 [Pyrenophora tritici-repentis]|nr:hypothetical protein Ptr902_11107 [Pyrenophora tritici-repentis]